MSNRAEVIGVPKIEGNSTMLSVGYEGKQYRARIGADSTGQQLVIVTAASTPPIDRADAHIAYNVAQAAGEEAGCTTGRLVVAAQSARYHDTQTAEPAWTFTGDCN